MIRFGLHFDPVWGDFWTPKSLPNRSQNRSKMKLCQHDPMRPLQEGPRPPQEAPRPPQEAPRALKDLPRGRQRPLQAVPRTTPEALGGPISSSNPLLSNVLNKVDFLIKMFIGSFQEAIEKIQELTKINISEPLSCQASMPPSLQASERLPPRCLGGIREAQTICLQNRFPV